MRDEINESLSYVHTRGFSASRKTKDENWKTTKFRFRLRLFTLKNKKRMTKKEWQQQIWYCWCCPNNENYLRIKNETLWLAVQFSTFGFPSIFGAEKNVGKTIFWGDSARISASFFVFRLKTSRKSSSVNAALEPFESYSQLVSADLIPTFSSLIPCVEELKLHVTEVRYLK